MSPTIIFPVGKFGVIEVNVLATRENPLVVTAVPESIRYPSLVWVLAWKSVLIAFVDPGLYTCVRTYDRAVDAGHPEVHASVIVKVLTLFVESATLVQVFVTTALSLQTIAVEESL